MADKHAIATKTSEEFGKSMFDYIQRRAISSEITLEIDVSHMKYAITNALFSMLISPDIETLPKQLRKHRKHRKAKKAKKAKKEDKPKKTRKYNLKPPENLITPPDDHITCCYFIVGIRNPSKFCGAPVLGKSRFCWKCHDKKSAEVQAIAHGWDWDEQLILKEEDPEAPDAPKEEPEISEEAPEEEPEISEETSEEDPWDHKSPQNG